MLAELPPGTIVGAFEILAPIGRGGMGEVYHARNRITGEERALKVMLPEFAAEPRFVERFVREIRLATSVDHPNLARVFEPAMDGNLIFLPMELLIGEALATRLQRGVLGDDEILVVLEAVGSALGALHAKGILHRDVKPSNVYLTVNTAGNMVPKLLDLGAGKEVDGANEGDATLTGTAVGSPHYMAPEQAAGRKDLDARADQYALGVLAYQLITGERPYENDEQGHVLSKLLSGAPIKRPTERRDGIPPELEAIILRSMNRDRDKRFRSVEEMMKRVRAAWPGGTDAPSSRETTRFAPLPVPTAPPAHVVEEGPSTTAARAVGVARTSKATPAAVGALVGVAAFVLVVVVIYPRFANRPQATVTDSPETSFKTVPHAAPPPVPPPPSWAESPPLPPVDSSLAASPPPPPPPGSASPPTPPKRTRPPPAPEPCTPTPGAPCL